MTNVCMQQDLAWLDKSKGDSWHSTPFALQEERAAHSPPIFICNCQRCLGSRVYMRSYTRKCFAEMERGTEPGRESQIDVEEKEGKNKKNEAEPRAVNTPGYFYPKLFLKRQYHPGECFSHGPILESPLLCRKGWDILCKLNQANEIFTQTSVAQNHFISPARTLCEINYILERASKTI